MIVMICGPDRVGKNTQIKMLKSKIGMPNFHELHYTADLVKGFEYTPEQKQDISKDYYNEMFDILNDFNELNISVICNRAHLGEYVYGKMYRKYSGKYIFDIEKDFPDLMEDIHLIVFTDTVDNLLKREDGNSLSNTNNFSTSDEWNLKLKEIIRFEKAFKKSNIRHKKLISITNKTPEQVHEEVMEFLKNDI